MKANCTTAIDQSTHTEKSFNIFWMDLIYFVSLYSRTQNDNYIKSILHFL